MVIAPHPAAGQAVRDSAREAEAAVARASVWAVRGRAEALAIALRAAGLATSRVARSDARAEAASARSQPAERAPVVAGVDQSAGSMAAVAAAAAGRAPTASIAGDAEQFRGAPRVPWGAPSVCG